MATAEGKAVVAPKHLGPLEASLIHTEGSPARGRARIARDLYPVTKLSFSSGLMEESRDSALSEGERSSGGRP
jgi:hypothetical protein